MSTIALEIPSSDSKASELESAQRMLDIVMGSHMLADKRIQRYREFLREILPAAIAKSMPGYDTKYGSEFFVEMSLIIEDLDFDLDLNALTLASSIVNLRREKTNL